MKKLLLLFTLFFVGCSANSPTSSLTHTHIAGTPVIENKVEATCEKNGSYDEVVYCIEDNVELSRKNISIPSLEHTIESVEISRKDPTYEEDGYFEEAKYCSVCSTLISLETISIPKLDRSSKGLAYQILDNASCVITGIGSCTDTEIYIPEYIDEVKVTSISANAFKDCTNVTKVVLSNFITEIGENAFYNCTNLINFVSNDNLIAIGNQAYYGCTGLSEFTLTKNIVTIGNDIFKNANNLKTLYFKCDNNLDSQVTNSHLITSSITKIVFGGKNIQIPKFHTSDFINIKEIEVLVEPGLSNLALPLLVNNLNNICYNESVTSIIIGEGITKIGGNCFNNCKSLESITLPKSLIEIGYGTFDNYANNLKNIYYTGTIEDWCNIKIGSDYDSDCEPQHDESNPMSDQNIVYGFFLSKKNFYILNEQNEWYILPKNIIVPQTITSIGINQFNGFKIESIELPNTITFIDERAFMGTHLKSIIIPEGVRFIGKYAFYGCYDLEKIILPKSLELIEEGAFTDDRHPQGSSFKELEVYYTGTAEQWSSIRIKDDNARLKIPTFNYEYYM